MVFTNRYSNIQGFVFNVDKAPNYILVMDRDAAVATEGAKLAQEIMLTFQIGQNLLQCMKTKRMG